MGFLSGFMRPATKNSLGWSWVKTPSLTSARSRYAEISLRSVGAVSLLKKTVPRLALMEGSISPAGDSRGAPLA